MKYLKIILLLGLIKLSVNSAVAQVTNYDSAMVAINYSNLILEIGEYIENNGYDSLKFKEAINLDYRVSSIKFLFIHGTAHQRFFDRLVYQNKLVIDYIEVLRFGSKLSLENQLSKLNHIKSIRPLEYNMSAVFKNPKDNNSYQSTIKYESCTPIINEIYSRIIMSLIDKDDFESAMPIIEEYGNLANFDLSYFLLIAYTYSNSKLNFKQKEKEIDVKNVNLLVKAMLLYSQIPIDKRNRLNEVASINELTLEKLLYSTLENQKSTIWKRDWSNDLGKLYVYSAYKLTHYKVFNKQYVDLFTNGFNMVDSSSWDKDDITSLNYFLFEIPLEKKIKNKLLDVCINLALTSSYTTSYMVSFYEKLVKELNRKDLKHKVDKLRRLQMRKLRKENFYIGFHLYPLALMPKTGFRDFGGTMLIRSYRLAYEINGRKINSNRDIAIDQQFNKNYQPNQRYLWDGYQYGVGIYKHNGEFVKSKQIGVLFDYTIKNYKSIVTNQTDKTIPNASIVKNIVPKSQRISLMINYNYWIFKNNLSILLFASIGMSGSSWDVGSEINHSQYSYGDTLIQNRQKTKMITPTGRLGLAIGFYVPKGSF